MARLPLRVAWMLSSCRRLPSRHTFRHGAPVGAATPHVSDRRFGALWCGVHHDRLAASWMAWLRSRVAPRCRDCLRYYRDRLGCFRSWLGGRRHGIAAAGLGRSQMWRYDSVRSSCHDTLQFCISGHDGDICCCSVFGRRCCVLSVYSRLVFAPLCGALGWNGAQRCIACWFVHGTLIICASHEACTQLLRTWTCAVVLCIEMFTAVFYLRCIGPEDVKMAVLSAHRRVGHASTYSCRCHAH
jgi:hypothetical protein